jgi:biopolymer transport protein ExbB/TolQ
MSDKKISEENLKKYISTLKSQLSFYRDRCLEFQQREWREDELEDEISQLKEQHKQEKNQLLEQIDVLKSFINDVSSIKDKDRNSSVPKQETGGRQAEKKKESVPESPYFRANQQNKKNRTSSDEWFMRVLHEQNAIDND